MVVQNSEYDFSYKYDVDELFGENTPIDVSGFGDDDEQEVNYEKKTSMWRYTSIGKLRNVINAKENSMGCLFFYKAQKFRKEDEYEGTIPDLAIQSAKDQYESLVESRYDSESIKSPDSVEDWAEYHKQVAEKMRKLSYINCWRYGERESDLMWKKFTSSGSGVAIKSNAEDFVESFEKWPGRLFIGETRYRYNDFNYHNFNRMTPLFIKRSEYMGEQELRAVITLSDKEINMNHKPKTYPEPVDDDLACAEVNLEKLISKIVVHPDSDLLKNVVEDILQVANLDVPVEKSSL
ncbi:hypothetical protein [Halorubrum halophilum]|uniref:hypothetical protein n=1 Tax=Halorubrum halophilum TaxID=413816 RepID=UPI00186ACE42|nr:hypothetical protein [Halorubrum halophilum]